MMEVVTRDEGKKDEEVEVGREEMEITKVRPKKKEVNCVKVSQRGELPGSTRCLLLSFMTGPKFGARGSSSLSTSPIIEVPK